MNKTIYHQLKELLVSSSILFLTLFMLSFDFFVQTENDDYLILNKIVSEVKNRNHKKPIYIETNNNNEFVVLIIKNLKEAQKNEIVLDSLKQSYNIDDNIVFETIFNKNEYDSLISQKANFNWDMKKINTENIHLKKNNEINLGKLVLTVSKPIYVKNNNYALVYYSFKSSSGIIVYEKKENKWIQFKMICPMLIQQKAKYIKQ